ncbi:NEDD8-activating enzyme E1 catalytic subunit, partial [Zootermopsis nevadensis]
RWCHLRKVLERSGPFCHPDFEPSTENLSFLMGSCKVLVIGAGGLGCELLKDLALMGFKDIHVIDMDTVELSNLNRQFLFRRRDIGQSKAEVAAKFITTRIPGCHVTPHFCKIQDFDENFYSSFHIVVCGLDSIVARRWINGMLISLLSYQDGTLDQSTLIPMVDGGTEGFKGNVRVILPGITACIECTLDLFPPQVTFPLCTIANTPRLPEHCIEYVKVIQWSKENPWDIPIDGDDPQHINWIYEKAMERATQFGIQGITYRLAAACATEVFKLATSCCIPLDNYMVFNDADGVYTYTYQAERKEDCLACSQVPKTLEISGPEAKLQDIITVLCESQKFQMKSPGLTANIDGKNRTLYMPTVTSIEEKTRVNLKKSLTELGLEDGSQLMVADSTSPNTLVVILKFVSSPDIDMQANEKSSV